MRRTVTYAKLQGAEAFTVKSGNLGNTLPPTSKVIKGFSMHLDSEFPSALFVNTSAESFIIPLANVQVAVLGTNIEAVGDNVVAINNK